MFSVNITVLVILVPLLISVHPSDAWRRRRRRRCPVQDCQVSSWSSWSVDNKDHKADQDIKNLLRLAEAQNALNYTKHGSAMPVLKRIDCQLSSWSECTASTVPCGVSGTQHSARHRIVTEQCGGTCTNTFRKTRACPDLSCSNGGSLKDGICFCKEGYSGNCCEKKGNMKNVLRHR